MKQTNFVPIVVPETTPQVEFYVAQGFARDYLCPHISKSKRMYCNVPYYYFKSRFRGLDRSFQKFVERFGSKAVIFLSPDDVIVYLGCGHIHIWDAKKPYPEPGKPGEFQLEKVRFLNWFKDVFPN